MKPVFPLSTLVRQFPVKAGLGWILKASQALRMMGFYQQNLMPSVGHATATQVDASDVLPPAEPETSANASNRTCSVQTFVDYEIQLIGPTDAPSEGNKTVSVEYAKTDVNHGDGDPGNMRPDELESSDSNWIEGSEFRCRLLRFRNRFVCRHR